MDFLQDLKIALADLQARYPDGDAPLIVVRRIAELERIIAWSDKLINRPPYDHDAADDDAAVG